MAPLRTDNSFDSLTEGFITPPLRGPAVALSEQQENLTQNASEVECDSESLVRLIIQARLVNARD